MSETKFCRDCAHFERFGGAYADCLHPSATQRQSDERAWLVTGKLDTSTHQLSAQSMRGRDACGPDAKLFVKRERRPALATAYRISFTLFAIAGFLSLVIWALRAFGGAR